MINEELPEWASQFADSDGNAVCKDCGKVQAASFKACIYCCKHNELDFTEDWHCGWNLDVECAICGKNFDFSNETIIREYKAVKKNA